MKVIQTTVVAAALAFGMGTAGYAAPLSNLIAGGTLTQGSVTFSGFTYEDVGGGFGDLAVAASSIDVATSAGTSSVSLEFSFGSSGLALTAGDVFEITGMFTANIASGSSLEFTTIGMSLDGAATPVTDFSVVEAGSNTLGETVGTTSENGVFSIGPFDASNAKTISLFEWDAVGEAADGADTALLRSFSIEFGLKDTSPPPDVIPLPAGLPLMLAGIGAFGWVARRRRS